MTISNYSTEHEIVDCMQTTDPAPIFLLIGAAFVFGVFIGVITAQVL